jgi:hypothetical protein
MLTLSLWMAQVKKTIGTMPYRKPCMDVRGVALNWLQYVLRMARCRVTAGSN